MHETVIIIEWLRYGGYEYPKTEYRNNNYYWLNDSSVLKMLVCPFDGFVLIITINGFAIN